MEICLLRLIFTNLTNNKTTKITKIYKIKFGNMIIKLNKASVA
jgi:hypothetical protein